MKPAALPGAPPKRTGNRSSRSSKYARRTRDLVYMTWVRTLPCFMTTPAGRVRPAEAGPVTSCWGPVEADHQGDRPGLGQKAPDDTTVPMCQRHHDERGNLHGSFKGWQAPQMKTFRHLAVSATQALRLRAVDARSHL